MHENPEPSPCLLERAQSVGYPERDADVSHRIQVYEHALVAWRHVPLLPHAPLYCPNLDVSGEVGLAGGEPR